VDLDELAEITNEYSGSDLKGEHTMSFHLLHKETEHGSQDLCVSAVMAAVKEAIGEADWKSIIKFKHLESEPKSKNPSVEKKEGNTTTNESQPNGDHKSPFRART